MVLVGDVIEDHWGPTNMMEAMVMDRDEEFMMSIENVR